MLEEWSPLSEEEQRREAKRIRDVLKEAEAPIAEFRNRSGKIHISIELDPATSAHHVYVKHGKRNNPKFLTEIEISGDSIALVQRSARQGRGPRVNLLGDDNWHDVSRENFKEVQELLDFPDRFQPVTP